MEQHLRERLSSEEGEFKATWTTMRDGTRLLTLRRGACETFLCDGHRNIVAAIDQAFGEEE